MDNALQSVVDAAVWGSLIANVVLGSFMLVQAIADPGRRPRFGAFSIVCLVIATIDFIFSQHLIPAFSPLHYEVSRLFAWCAYGAAALYVLDLPLAWAAGGGAAFAGIGAAFWLSGHLMSGYLPLATTMTFPIIFLGTAGAHGWQFKIHRGYASAVLCASSTAIAIMCALFSQIVRKSVEGGHPEVFALGYAHFAIVTILSVLLGWIHLPRELRGRAPVSVNPRHAILMYVAVLASEGFVQLSLLAYPSRPPYLYLLATVVQFGALLLFFFYHRHLLVIHTDNIAGLLDERTASLRVAQSELSLQNDNLARRLEEQARELRSKAEVIERQRRLELAGQTTGQVAHDIQNLIAPILSHVSRLQHLGKKPEDVQGVAATLRGQVEQLLDLNSQMLALSRRGRLELSPVDLGELLPDLKLRFPGQPLVLDSGRDLWISGSWSQLSRALSNLVSNALEAGPDQRSPVSIACSMLTVAETRRCHLGFLTPGEYVRIRVEDKGPGIKPEVIDRIFEPFFSSKDGTRSSGSGLGLTIVAAIVEDHRGILDLETGPQGTAFTIYLPRIQAPGGRIDLRSLSGQETVAVIDDDTSILETYSDILKEAGYTVYCANSGAAALELIQKEAISLLLLDLKMPQMTGFDTFFGAMHLHPGIEAVIHSSFITDDEIRKLEAMGVAAVLQKPASRLEVLKTLRQVLDKIPPSGVPRKTAD